MNEKNSLNSRKFYRIDPTKLNNFLKKFVAHRSTLVNIETQTEFSSTKSESSEPTDDASTSVSERLTGAKQLGVAIRSNIRDIFTDFSSNDDED